MTAEKWVLIAMMLATFAVGSLGALGPGWRDAVWRYAVLMLAFQAALGTIL